MIEHVKIKSGSKGRVVAAIQRALNQRGENVQVDGSCGPATLGAAARALCLPSPRELGADEFARLGVRLSYGIDLSGHNEGGGKKPVDFEAVKAAGVSFVYVKLTEGGSYSNAEAVRQASECQRLGIAVGGYHFGDPSAKRPLDLLDLEGDARAEASHYLETRKRTFGAVAPTLSDVLDLERTYQSSLTPAAWAAIGGTTAKRAELCALWCLSWLDHVRAVTGRRPMIYTGKWAYDAYLARAPKALLAKLAESPLWLASYNAGSEPARQLVAWPWTVWQYSGSGLCPGVDGKADLNVCLAEDL